MDKIKVMIVGYGNVGRGVRKSIAANTDMELVGIISRGPERVKKELPEMPVFHIDDVDTWKKELNPDVAILCGGSKNDLPVQGPALAKHVCTVDSFDNHSCIPQYFAEMDKIAKNAGTSAVISTGWDPGIFSLERVLASAFLPGSNAYGFYGLGEKGGLSMGHSDALRTLDGVIDARQFTHAIPEAIERIRKGENPEFAAGDMHWRECFVVVEEGVDKAALEEQIKSMPGYFEPYKTVVNFISQEELDSKYAGFPHDGCVVASGTTGDGSKAMVEYRCAWESNPEATANVLIAHARGVVRMFKEGKRGAFTILDIPAAYMSQHSQETLLAKFM
ncbi:MAG: diaminopimelate dehydrogenase [Lentisphaerae bacterium]|nr:diaminopimelate dehydrogenase [Lentisphaerota bacterium]MCP4102590.1 diaminopimelate dehydrogenase [Lentisphaerota bacterium]